MEEEIQQGLLELQTTEYGQKHIKGNEQLTDENYGKLDPLAETKYSTESLSAASLIPTIEFDGLALQGGQNDKNYLMITLGDNIKTFEVNNDSLESVDPEQLPINLAKNRISEYQSVLESNRLYVKLEDQIEEVTLRSSKLDGRHKILTYADFPSTFFVTLSADFCISKIPMNVKTFNSSISLGFICPFCGKLFDKWHNLHNQHIHLHGNPVVCRACGIMQEDNLELINHKKICKFNCKICRKSFVSESKLKDHIVIHC